MLPINVDGVVWLSTNMTEYSPSFWLLFAFLTGSVGGALIFMGIITFIKEGIITAMSPLLIGIMVFCLMMFALERENIREDNFIPEPESYVVYFTEDTDYKKLYENYNIIDEQDNLITIELKEN